MSMNVIPPLAITPAMLTSTSAIEVAPALHNPATTYALGATVGVAGGAGSITVYRSLQAGNSGHAPGASPLWWVDIGDTYQSYLVGGNYALGDRVIDPAAHLVSESLVGGNVGNPLTDGTKWKVIGPTNPWAMFDTSRNTATILPSGVPLIVTITPGDRIDALALLGLAATTATITVVVGGVVVYAKTIDLNLRFVSNWYEYFFARFKTKESVALFDLPPYTDGIITISLTNVEAPVACGAAVLGMKVYLGAVEYGAESDVLNYSQVDRSDGDVAVFQPSRNVPKTVSTIWLGKQYVDQARDLRKSLNGATAVWAGLDDDTHAYFEALLILGFYTRFTINLEHLTKALISLELEEV